jgi:hypothetical protein
MAAKVGMSGLQPGGMGVVGRAPSLGNVPGPVVAGVQPRAFPQPQWGAGQGGST